MSYNIALNFEDGVTRFVSCNEGETVLDAAYRAQINLPMDCSDGVCGTCKGACRQGDFDMGEEFRRVLFRSIVWWKCLSLPPCAKRAMPKSVVPWRR